MNTRLITVSILFLLASCHQRVAPSVPAEESMVVDSRLSNQKVNGFAQDALGQIWMATGRGLDKYAAGEYYQYFCTDDTLGLPDNQVNAVLCQRSGRLWAATVNGAAWLTERNNFHRVNIPDWNRNISSVMETRDGRVLLSNGSKLFVYDDASDTLRLAAREISAFGSPSMALDSDDRLWVNAGWAVSAYNTSDFSLVETIPLPFLAYHICDASNGEIWLSGMGSLGILDSRTMELKPIPEAIRRTRDIMQGDVDIIYAIDSRSILLHVIGKGTYYYNRAREEVLFQEDDRFPFTLPDGELRTIFLDKDQNLWFGTTDQGYGVSYRNADQFNGNPALTAAFSHKTVVSLDMDKAGNLWISTLRDGLWCYNLQTKALREVDIDPLIPDRSVGFIRCSKVFCDSGGDLWLLFTGKYRVIRCRWDGHSLKALDQIGITSPIAIAEDDRGHIWIGGFGQQLIHYDKQKRLSSTVTIPPEGGWTFVTDMLLSEPGQLLVASFGQPVVSVNCYSEEAKVTNVPTEDLEQFVRRSTLIPNKLYKDSTGDIWVGTVANGLILHLKDSLHPRIIEDVPCLDIASIQEDRQGNVWVSTQYGLGKYDRTVGRMVSYTEEDGIGGNQFSDRASCILSDGTLLFGGTHGITCFNPLNAPGTRTVPLVFETLTVHNTLVAPSENGPIPKALSGKPEIVIRPSQNAFGISFAALDYSEFEKIRYAYRLEGFDRDWVRLGTRHSAYFANLPAGKYTLHVRIADGSHSVIETVESLPIRVLPPWYRTWWAVLLYILAGAFLIGVGYTFYRHVRRVRKEAARRIHEVRRERERAEEAQAAEKALNKIQMNYFSNVAHEFRTPLTMIAGPAQQLSSSPSLRGEDRHLVDIIRRNSTWMLSLVNQLLDFNRIGNSKLQLKVAKTDIVQPLKDAVQLFSYNAGSKGVDLNSTGLEEPLVMWVDADKVQKIVMNLMSNALKFTPSGGKVSLGFDVVTREYAAERFPLKDTDTDSRWACISVSDTGPGIPEEEMEKIFERFYQTPDGKKSYGSGIGLFYARALSGLHHGYIKAFPKEEGGALFSMVLPVSASSYSEDERTSETPELQLHAFMQNLPEQDLKPQENSRHIAIVDDDIDIANYLKMLLSPSYRVSVYFDGAFALRGMADEAPDLVISDVVMPGMDGYELCSRIKSDLQLSHIPVVLVTAKVAVESQVQGLAKGADAYVTKPFQPAYLLALVKSLLENREKLRRQLGSVTTTEDIAPEAMSPRDAAFMKELYELMEKELANSDLDIVRMTEMMKISRTKFYYKVKGLTGENPSVFFKRYKLNRAADLLREGKHNMSEIAWMTGFNTLSHFSTSFKKQFGVPPSEFVG